MVLYDEVSDDDVCCSGRPDSQPGTSSVGGSECQDAVEPRDDDSQADDDLQVRQSTSS